MGQSRWRKSKSNIKEVLMKDYYVIKSDDINFEYNMYKYGKRIKIDEINNSIETLDAFFIITNSRKFFLEACENIRQLTNYHLYLKPVILITDSLNSSWEKEMADLHINQEQIENEEKTTKKISQVINRINDVINKRILDAGSDENIYLKILRFIYTREGEILPIRSVRSYFGLSYPPLECFLSNNKYEIFSLLNILEENGSLIGTFYEKVHLCNECQCAFLNFMEVCPNCGSADLAQENLIHHFPCAYMAPEKDFVKGDRLVCPKCKKQLKGLGVDYDQPSSIFRCNHCGYVTQDPEVKTICFNCGKESSPEDLILKTVKKYNITSIGENFALYGLESPLIRILKKEELNIMPYDAFKMLIQIEIERNKRYKVTSSIILLRLENINKIYERMGNKLDDLLKEISAIIKNSTRNSDAITVLNESLILVFLSHTPSEGAKIVMDRITESVKNLISENLGIKPIVSASYIEITKDYKNSTVLLENLLKRLD
jgi:GGDEF domain-containing protein/RNA polymerase subunit RPABC4/transcription elongation factor Spt4